MFNIYNRWQTALAHLQYAVGAFAFYRGVAGWHPWFHAKAMAMLQRSADKGLAKSQLLFGQLLCFRGVSMINRRAGMTYLQRAAEQNIGNANFMLAEYLAKHPDEKPANLNVIELYRQADSQGVLMAALRLQQAYAQGLHGLMVDESQARYWAQRFTRRQVRDVQE